MNAPLCLVEAEDLQRAEEDQIIEEASLILDRRMFTRGPLLYSPQDVRDFLKLKLAGHEHEVFASVFLDNRHRVIAFEELFFGTVDGASVYPRQLVKCALHWNCAALIITHNHPFGCSEPSQADRQLTERLKDALALVHVRVLDHFIVGAGRPLSLADTAGCNQLTTLHGEHAQLDERLTRQQAQLTALLNLPEDPRWQRLTLRIEELKTRTAPQPKPVASFLKTAPRPAPARSAPALPALPLLIGLELRGPERFLAITPAGSQTLNEVRLLRSGDRFGAWTLQRLDRKVAVFASPGQPDQTLALP